MIRTVESASQLYAALKTVQSGDTIRLATGDYGSISISNMKFDGVVTIESANAAKPAVFTGLSLSKVEGLALSGLEISVQADAAWNQRLYVSASERVSISGFDVHGPAANPSSAQTLAIVRNSSDVRVSDSEFSYGQHGLTVMESEAIEVDGNRFHDMRTDGLRVAGIEGIEITGNQFTDFFPAAGDHPDAIQFWTTNLKYSSSDILIEGNIITRGKGSAMQGIFISDQVGTLPYKDVTITGNFLSGTMYNGIVIEHGDGVEISDNVVIGWSDMKSWIRAIASPDVVETGNTTTAINNDLISNVIATGNTIVAAPLDQGASLLKAYLARLAGPDMQRLEGSAASDRLGGSGDHDRIDGLGGDDYITGGVGDEWLLGGAGDDRLFGQTGSDMLDGGVGADVLTGGAGADRLTGGKGPDKFVFSTEDFAIRQSTPDMILDFNRAEGDRIVLNGIDARVATLIRDKFSFVGTQAFSGTAGEVRYEVRGADAYVMGDVNGDRVADIVIGVKGVTSLSVSDFIL